jgi:hypothetical protein
MAGNRSPDEKLDEALRETFPGSDAIAPGITTSTEPVGQPLDRHTPPITHEQIEDAQQALDDADRVLRNHAVPGDEVPPGTPGAIRAPCPTCKGTGRIASLICSNCDGQGTILRRGPAP